jgi:RND superfamily putative drug exporter
MLIVLILGAGTDYGVFLVFRVREELRRGLSGPDAVRRAVTRVGESITFSAFTVIAALSSVALAEFGLYQSMGPALAIGIAIMLAAGLTLLPALLAIFGRAVFWPSDVSHNRVEHVGIWDRVGLIATRRPALTLILGAILFGGMAATLLTTGTSGFGDVGVHDHRRLRFRGRRRAERPLPVVEGRADAGPVPVRQPRLAEPGRARDGPGRTRGAAAVQERRRAAQSQRHPADDRPADSAPHGPGAGPPAAAGADDVAVPADLYNAYRAEGQLISPDGLTVEYSAEVGGADQSSPAALDTVPGLRDEVDAGRRIGRRDRDRAARQPRVLLRHPPDLGFGPGADHPDRGDPDRDPAGGGDAQRVAPLYLVASVVISYLGALGLTGILFVRLGGQAVSTSSCRS